MKINELIKDFSIFTTNEEKTILETIDGVLPMSSFNERDQIIIANLIRKSLVSKVIHQGSIMVVKNGKN